MFLWNTRSIFSTRYPKGTKYFGIDWNFGNWRDKFRSKIGFSRVPIGNSEQSGEKATSSLGVTLTSVFAVIIILMVAGFILAAYFRQKMCFRPRPDRVSAGNNFNFMRLLSSRRPPRASMAIKPNTVKNISSQFQKLDTESQNHSAPVVPNSHTKQGFAVKLLSPTQVGQRFIALKIKEFLISKLIF